MLFWFINLNKNRALCKVCEKGYLKEFEKFSTARVLDAEPLNKIFQAKFFDHFLFPKS